MSPGVTSIAAFHHFSKISLRHASTSIWKNMKYQRISKYPLKPAVRFDGVLSKFKFDRIFEYSRRLLTVETGVRVHQTSNDLARPFDQALSFWRLLSRYERDSRSTLNGSGAKKLIIVPSTMTRNHVPIRSATRSAAFFEKTFSFFVKSISM